MHMCMQYLQCPDLSVTVVGLVAAGGVQGGGAQDGGQAGVDQAGDGQGKGAGAGLLLPAAGVESGIAENGRTTILKQPDISQLRSQLINRLRTCHHIYMWDMGTTVYC